MNLTMYFRNNPKRKFALKNKQYNKSQNKSVLIFLLAGYSIKQSYM